MISTNESPLACAEADGSTRSSSISVIVVVVVEPSTTTEALLSLQFALGFRINQDLSWADLERGPVRTGPIAPELLSQAGISAPLNALNHWMSPIVHTCIMLRAPPGPPFQP